MSERRNVYLLSLTSFLNDLSSETILSILPFFLKSFGATFYGIGLIGGLIDGLGNIAKVFSGYVSDFFGKRKPLVFFGYFISQVSKLCLSFSSSTLFAGAFISIDRLGKGTRTAPRDALISESKWKSGTAFGFHRAMDTFGAVIGSLIALILVFHGIKFSGAIVYAALIGFLAIIPIIFVKETGKIKKPVLGFKMKKYVAFAAFLGFCNVSYMFFMLKAAKLSIELAIALYLLFNVIYALTSYPFGILADKIGKAKVLSLAYIMLSISAILMTRVNLIAFILAFSFYGLFMAVAEAQQRALASDLSISKGFGIGAFHFTYGTSTILCNILAGAMASFSINYVFVYLSIVAIFASLLLEKNF